MNDILSESWTDEDKLKEHDAVLGRLVRRIERLEVGIAEFERARTADKPLPRGMMDVAFHRVLQAEFIRKMRDPEPVLPWSNPLK